MKDIFLTRIEFEESGDLSLLKKDKYVAGHLHLKSSEEVTLEKLSVELQFEVSGQLVKQELRLDTFYIIKEPQFIEKDKYYKFGFALERNYHGETYRGSNASFNYNIEITISPNDDFYNGFSRSVVSGFKEIFTGDKSLKYTKPAPLFRTSTPYDLTTQKLELKAKQNPVLGGFLAILLAIIFLVFNPDWVFGIFIGIAIGTFLISIPIQTYMINRSLGKLSATIKPFDDNHFECTIDQSKNLVKISDPIIYFEILEEVADRRGTSNTSYSHTVFQSAVQRYIRDDVFKFEYPAKRWLSTNRLNDAEIRWQINFQLYKLGIKYIAEAYFVVSKKKE